MQRHWCRTSPTSYSREDLHFVLWFKSYFFFFFEWILIVRSTWHAVDFEGKAGQGLPMLFLQPLEKVVLPVEGGSGGGGC